MTVRRGLAVLGILAVSICALGATTKKYDEGLINLSVCYRGLRPSLVLGSPLQSFAVVHKTWGPPYFRMGAHVLAWPGGQIGILANSAGYCSGEFDADAYMKQWNADHPDADDDTTDDDETPGTPT